MDGNRERSPTAKAKAAEPPSSADATRSLARSAAETTGTLPLEPQFAPAQAAGDVGKLGRYRVVKKLGQGGMGAVYQGYDAVLDRKVALKVMLPHYAANPDARERFLREARTAAMIRNDHVVTIFDVDEEGGIPFIAMEYLHGYPLDQYLKTKGELPLAHVLRVGRETALGLAAAHELGLIHRDIKPANLWLESPRGRIKLLDFGLARAENDDGHLTNTGDVVGTPAYMSPEQARGDKVDHRTDLFSLGVMLYRLSTGKMPFKGNSVMAILTSLAVDTPPPVRSLKPELPEALESLINGLLVKDPAGRIQTAMEVVKALREIEAPKGSGLLAVAVPAEAIPMAISVQESNPWEALDASGAQPQALASATEAMPSASPRPERKPAARKAPLLPLMAAGVGLLALIAALAVVVPRMLKKDEPVAKQEEPEEQRPKSIGGHPPTPVVIDPDRRAAEWVLSVGGFPHVNGQSKNLRAVDELPKVRFSLTGVVLENNEKVTNADLAVFKDCKELAGLKLGGTKVTDGGLAHFKGYKGLTKIWLADTQVGDAGLAHFKDCRFLIYLDVRKTKVTVPGIAEFAKSHPRCQIEWDGPTIEPPAGFAADRKAAEWVLGVGGTVQINGVEKDLRTAAELSAEHYVLTSVNLKRNASVTDDSLAVFRDCQYLISLQLDGTNVRAKGLQHLTGCKSLMALFLNDTGVGDAELAVIKDCRNLLFLYLNDGTVTDDGLANLKDWTRLTQIGLYGAPVTEKGLAHLKSCKNLTMANLNGTQVGDPVFETLKGCRWLYYLDVSRSKVTAAKVAEFAKVNPRCTVIHGRTIKPTVVLDQDRRAAEWVLSIGGSVMVNGEEKEIKAETDLPRSLFKLTTVNLTNIKAVADADLLYLFECGSLTRLYLGNTPVGDAGLTMLRRSPALATLDLGGTQVGDAGMAILGNCVGLRELYLGSTQVGDLGLSHLGQIKNLADLSLRATKVTNAGLEHLKACKQLTQLNVQKTRVTTDAIAEFRKELPRCKVDHDPAAEPGAAADPDRTAAEWILSIGGSVGVNGQETRIQTADELPKERFTLNSVYLLDNPSVVDPELASLENCKNLTHLYLTRTQVSDAGLAYFKGCKTLTTLSLTGTLTTDVGLANFKDCKDLTELGLEQTQVTEAGLAPFKECKLVSLHLRETKVTATWIAGFAKANPQCRIIWDGGTIEPRP